ncbi:MAG: hypothetical protein LBL13_04810 [Bacteroidales bacterium]|jgi:hypothetical protein|nr:hypothetical protein [Bacteroidales bacterium]
MVLNFFLLLPQTNGIILDIIQNECSYKQFVKEISDTISVLRRDNSMKLFYDSDNINTFIETCKEFESETYLANAATQIRSFISTKSIDVHDNPTKDNRCIYVLWNLDKLPNVEYAPEIITETVERMCLYPDGKFLLLNILEEIKTDRDVLLVCKDAKHISELPVFARIPYVTDKSELESWISLNYIPIFSLLDKSRFTKTKLIVQGQSVFQENHTSRYWYLDNFHKTHYEVFDDTGKHLGESDSQGQIDFSKKDATKTINI